MEDWEGKDVRWCTSNFAEDRIPANKVLIPTFYNKKGEKKRKTDKKKEKTNKRREQKK